MLRSLAHLLPALLLAFAVTACETEEEPVVPEDPVTEAPPALELPDDLVTALEGHANLSTFQRALERVGPRVIPSGPYTLFAPTNEAFEELDDAMNGTLFEADNSALLADILRGHLVSGRVTAEDIASRPGITLGGEEVQIQTTPDGGVLLGEAQVVETGIEAGDGLIHVIDEVFVPGEFGLESDM